MDKRIFITISLILLIQSINSQEINTKENDTILITLDCSPMKLDYDVLFVITLGDKCFQTFKSYKKFKDDYNILPNQIESINVIRNGNETIKKYGKNSKNGVILISLKLSSQADFNEKLKTEFMKRDD